MEVLTRLVLTHLEDHRVQAPSGPADGPVLLGQIGAPIEIVGVREDLLCLLKTESAPWVALSRLLFRPSKRNRISV